MTEPIDDLTEYGHDQDRGPPQTREDQDRLEDFSPDDFDIEDHAMRSDAEIGFVRSWLAGETQEDHTRFGRDRCLFAGSP